MLDAEYEPSQSLVPLATSVLSAALPLRALPSTLDAWLQGRSPDTRRAYLTDLRAFGVFLGVVPAGARVEDAAKTALATFFSFAGPVANTYVLDWKNSMATAKLSPATINRKLSAMKSLAKMGRLTGKIQWAIDVDRVAGDNYKETDGPGVDVLKKAIAATAGQTHALRNKTIIEFLFHTGLRRMEIAALKVTDLDIATDNGRVRIKGKGRSETEWLDLSPAAVKTLRAWLVERGEQTDGYLGDSLFGLDRGGIYRAVRSAGALAGEKLRTHGIRHTATTEVLNQNGGDIRAAASFARHKDVAVTLRYDDNRKKLARGQATLLDGLLK